MAVLTILACGCERFYANTPPHRGAWVICPRHGHTQAIVNRWQRKPLPRTNTQPKE